MAAGDPGFPRHPEGYPDRIHNSQASGGAARSPIHLGIDDHLAVVNAQFGLPADDPFEVVVLPEHDD